MSDGERHDQPEYTYVSDLGSGGFGSVKLYQQTAPIRRLVAIKFLRADRLNEHAIARFEIEAQVLGHLRHEHIAQVYDYSRDEDGAPYMVMEYVDGAPIVEYCDREKLGVRERVRLFIDACEAIQYAHDNRVIHRDIKPDNILVSVDGGRPRVRVIDFGVAKVLEGPLSARPTHTVGGEVIGSYEFMSPEQTTGGSARIDVRADVYALGALLYELVCGVPALDLRGVPLDEVVRRIRSVDPPAPSDRVGAMDERDARAAASARGGAPGPLRAALRGDLDWAVLMALRKDPAERYRSASDLADDLRRYLDGMPLEAGPESRAYRAKKFVRRHTAAVATAGVIALLVVVGTVSTAFASWRALQNAERARQESDLNRELVTVLQEEIIEPIAGGLAPEAVLETAYASVERREGAPAMPAALGARLRGSLASALLITGDLDSAAELLDDALVELRSLSDAGDFDLISAELDRIEVHMRQGSGGFADLRRELGDLLGRIEDRHGRRSAEFDRVHNAVAMLLSTHAKRGGAPGAPLGDDEKARLLATCETIYQERAAYRTDVYGEHDERTLTARYNIGLLRLHAGRHEEAAAVFEDVLALAEAHLGASHKVSLWCRTELASAHYRRFRDASPDGREGAGDHLDRSIELYEPLPRLMAEAYGVNHWRRLESMANYGQALNKAGRHLEAARVLAEALDGRDPSGGYRMTRGVLHGHTRTVTKWTVEAMLSSGDESLVREGRAIARRAIDEARRGLDGDGHTPAERQAFANYADSIDEVVASADPALAGAGVGAQASSSASTDAGN